MKKLGDAKWYNHYNTGRKQGKDFSLIINFIENEKLHEILLIQIIPVKVVSTD